MQQRSMRVLSDDRWKEVRSALLRFEDVEPTSRLLGVQCETLISIFVQRQQEVNKKTHHTHKTRASRYAERFRCGESLLQIADDSYGFDDASWMRCCRF